MSLTSKFTFGSKIIQAYRNWGSIFLEYFGFIKKKKMVYRLRNGTKILGRPNTCDFGIINDVMVKKCYHKFLPLLKKGGTVIDIGAQIGSFSVLAAKVHPDVKVFSFEPADDNYPLLCENIAFNGVEKQVVPLKLGIGSKKETRTMYFNKRLSGNHTIMKHIYMNRLKGVPYNEVSIPLISLNEAFKKFKIKQCDLLKLDCEGAEYEIIPSISSSTFKKIKAICLEYHSNGNVDTLIPILKKQGYRISLGSKKSQMLYAVR